MTLSPPSLAMEERLVSGNRSLAVWGKKYFKGHIGKHVVFKVQT